MGYSPWGHKESDTTEQLSTAQKQGTSEMREKLQVLSDLSSPHFHEVGVV